MTVPPKRPGRPSVAEKMARDVAARETPRDIAREDPQPVLEDKEESSHVAARNSIREDPRERAARRAAELRNNRGDDFNGIDEFHVDRSVVPDGWDYEWKTERIVGMENTSGLLAYRRAGWEEVPTRRHPEMMPIGTPGEEPIRRKDMLLMERPLEITIDARNKERKLAREQVSGKEEQLNQSEKGQFDRASVKISHSYEAMPIPE